MRAIVHDRYGSIDDLRLQEVPTPVPAEDEVLVRVRAASVHPDVWHVVTGQPAVLRLMGSGLRRPKPSVPGTDVAGVVVSVGGHVTRFRPGAPIATIRLVAPDLGLAMTATAVTGVLWSTFRLAVAYTGRTRGSPVG